MWPDKSMEKELIPAITWSFLDNLREGILVVEPNGNIEYINHAAYTILELTGNQAYLTLAEVLPAPVGRQLLHPPYTTQIAIAGQLVELEAHSWQGAAGELIQIFVRPDDTAVSAPAPIDHLTALTQISSEADFDKKLQLIVDGLRRTGWGKVSLTLRDEALNPTKLITAGFSPAEIRTLEKNMLPATNWQQFFDNRAFEQFRQGACYLVPEGRWSWDNLGQLLPDTAVSDHNNSQQWHEGDLLCVPLYGRQQKRIGLIGLDQPLNGRRPDNHTLQTIELYAQFAASIVESAQLYQEAVNRSRNLETLFATSNALSSTLDQNGVLLLLGKHMLRAINADGCTIYRWQEETATLQVLHDTATINHHLVFAPDTTFALENLSPFIANVLQTRKPVVRQVTEQGSSRLENGETVVTPLPGWVIPDQPCSYAVLPLILSEELFGLVTVVLCGDRQISGQELQLLASLVNQAAVALETALIFEDTYEREIFYNALGSVSMAINYTLDLRHVLSLICSESVRIFNVDGAYIWQLEGDHFLGSAASGHGEADFVGTTVATNETEIFVAAIAQSGEPTFLNNIHHNQQLKLKLPERHTIQAALGVPLEQDGRVIGVLILVDQSNPNRFTTKDLSRATIFAVQAANALQNAKLFAELRQLNEELDARVAQRTRDLHEESSRVKILLRITTELSASLDQDRVLTRALELVNEVVSASQGVIMLIDQESGELVFRAAFGYERPLSPKGVPSGMMQDEGLAGWIIANRSPVIVHDTHEDPRWVERETSKEHRSALAVPLITSEEVIGVLMLFHTKPNTFTMQQLDLVEAAAIQVANAINNANLYLLIRDQAERLGTMLRLEQIETAKNQAILESIADGVIVSDAQHKIILANMPAGSILDIPRDQLIDKSINELLGLYALADQSWVPAIEDWARNADRLQRWSYLEERLSIEDKVINVRVSPVLVSNQFFGTVSIFRDITKEVEVDRLKSEFVSTVSHELRTPMTSIKGYVDLLLMGAAGGMSQPQVRYLQVIKNNAERLHMLVNDLLNISRIETGKVALDLRPVDIADLIDQVVVGHVRGRIQHEDKQINVKTNLPDNLPLVNADHARVTQVLTNLLDNALNYTANGDKIEIAARPEGNTICISVTDNGIGISEENQKKIFDRFFRAEDSSVQKVPGTGLGLAIVRSIVEMHGGQLYVQSKLGRGSTFSFNLPVVLEDSEPT
jgi:signal transduction histidine kinase